MFISSTNMCAAVSVVVSMRKESANFYSKNYLVSIYISRKIVTEIVAILNAFVCKISFRTSAARNLLLASVNNIIKRRCSLTSACSVIPKHTPSGNLSDSISFTSSASAGTRFR